jgi:peptide/nickel transport system permease protein
VTAVARSHEKPALSTTPLLSIRDLHTHVFADGRTFRAVNGVDLDVIPGETIGVAGESGSGKTMLALSILRLLPPAARIVSGSILFRDVDLVAASPSHLRSLRGGMVSAIFQDPLTSLNPVLTIGDQIREVIRRHNPVSRREANARVVGLLDAVRIPRARQQLRAYPHELSGGMCQRVGIAIAIANHPKLLIADEPTTALDVTVQAEILQLLRELQDGLGMALVLITHDFGVVEEICDRVVVMYAGRVVEEARVDDVFADPSHPYTQRLMQCVPQLGHDGKAPKPIAGLPPALDQLPEGCAFAARCHLVEDRCRVGEIALVGRAGRRSRCIKSEGS